jgi:hypothetical protein
MSHHSCPSRVVVNVLAVAVLAVGCEAPERRDTIVAEDRRRRERRRNASRSFGELGSGQIKTLTRSKLPDMMASFATPD